MTASTWDGNLAVGLSIALLVATIGMLVVCVRGARKDWPSSDVTIRSLIVGCFFLLACIVAGGVIALVIGLRG